MCPNGLLLTYLALGVPCNGLCSRRSWPACALRLFLEALKKRQKDAEAVLRMVHTWLAVRARMLEIEAVLWLSGDIGASEPLRDYRRSVDKRIT